VKDMSDELHWWIEGEELNLLECCVKNIRCRLQCFSKSVIYYSDIRKEDTF